MKLKKLLLSSLAFALSLAVAEPLSADEAAPAGTASTAAPVYQDGDAAKPIATDDYGRQGDVPQDTYTREETLDAATKFFGGTSAGLAKAVEKAFSDLGRPVGYVIGSEGSGAIGIGLRYGSGVLKYKNGNSTKVYWQGPSIGPDVGGNGSKVFTLVYSLHWTNDLFQRFPGVDGSLYVVAGVGLNYQRTEGITLAPIRTGVGLRGGINVGYLKYTRTRTINPF